MKKYIVLIIIFCSTFICVEQIAAFPAKNTGSMSSTDILLSNQTKKNVTFNVFDGATSEPIVGANITVKGTSTGNITDVNGKGVLTDIRTGDVVVISYIGYHSQEITVGEGNSYRIVLKEDTQTLEELVVIGYGTMKKSDLTGSVKRVALEEKSSLPNVNLTQMLSGTSAGVNIHQKGLAGGESSLSIRGKTSLSASDAPLLVLDGIIYNGSLSDINPNDVEYIDILKDASAAAVYGSRSANGVIIVTTKKGRSDKPRVGFNAYYGYQGMSNNKMKVMDAEQYAIRLVDYYYQQNLYSWYKTAPTNDSGKPAYPDISDRKTVASTLRTQEERDNYLANKNIDWVRQVLRDNAPIQSYTVSLSGGNERFNYYASGSLIDEKGILKNDQFARYTLSTKLDGKVTDWLSLGLNINYSHRDYSGVNASLADARSASPLANWDLDSKENYATYLTGESYMPHPLRGLKVLDEDIRNNLFFVTNARIDIPWIKGLSYDFNYSNTFYTRKRNTFYPSSVSDGAGNKGKAEKTPEEQRSWIFNSILTYSREFGDHNLNATLLYSREKYRGESFKLISQGFENEALGFDNMTMGTQITTTDPHSWEETGLSYMGRINYQYKRKYLISGTVRRDGFSGFGMNSKYVTLPALSVGWVVSEESFNPNKDIYLKLRLSYGQNGNQGIGRYSSISGMKGVYYVYDSSPTVGVHPSTLGNAKLAWEKTTSLNLGFDFGFFDRRINGSVDVYKANTKDVLVKRKLPQSAGYPEVWTNIGALNNKGIDVELNTVNVQSRHFRWETGINFSLNRDRITKLYEGTYEDKGNSWFVGKPISAIYDYRIIGMWQESDLYSKNIYTDWYPGQYKYEDLNKDNMIDAENDRKIIGCRSPNYTISMTNTVSWKEWSLYFLLNSIQGGNGYYLFNNYAVVNVSQRSDDVYRINQSAVRQYWKPENKVTNSTGIYNSPAIHSGIYEDRSFIRLQDISLTYTFNKKVLKSLSGISQLQLYISGKNLYTWTNWSGWDPELVSSSETAINNYPSMRNVVFGIKLQF